MKISDRYNAQAEIKQKEALEKQYMRLKVYRDADDPCKPYLAPRAVPIPMTKLKSGDFDGDPIPQSFIDELKATGKAKTSFRKSDVAK